MRGVHLTAKVVEGVEVIEETSPRSPLQNLGPRLLPSQRSKMLRPHRPDERAGTGAHLSLDLEQAGTGLLELQHRSPRAGDQPAHEPTQVRLVTDDGNRLVGAVRPRPVGEVVV